MPMFVNTPPASTSAAAREAIELKMATAAKKILYSQSERLDKSTMSKTEASFKTEVPATAQSATSRCSEIEFIARKKRLELEAAQAKARIDKELIDQQLATEIAALEQECSVSGHNSRKSVSSVRDVEHKVCEWMHRSTLDAHEHPLASGQLQQATAAAAPTDIQQLACALKEAITSSTVEVTNRKFLSRLGTDRDLPPFHGDPLEWLTFKRAYSDSTELSKYTDAENLCRLRKCLRGEAKETVSSLLISNTSAAGVIETLELRYGRPEIIISRITQQLKKLSPLPPAYHNELINFSLKVKNYVAAAQAINQVDYLRSPELMTAVISKCPTTLITKWADYAYSNKDVNKPKLEMFAEFLYEEASKISLAGLSYVYTYNKKPDERKPQDVKHTVLVQSTKAEENKCKFCRGSYHTLPNCIKFKKAMRKDRWRFVRAKHICQKCLLSKHKRDECPASDCDVDSCGSPHHPLLHFPGAAAAASSSQESSQEPQAANVNTVNEENSAPSESALSESINNTISVSDSIVMLKIVPVTLHGPKGAFTTTALLDDGATISLIASDVADLIGLHGNKRQLRMRGAWNNNEIVCESESITCKINGIKYKNMLTLNAQKIKELNLPEQNLLKVDVSKYKHMYNTITDHITNLNCKPKVLIGQDNYDLLKPLQLITGNKNEPFCTLTPLGWCVHGLMSALSPAYLPSRNHDGRLCAISAHSYIDSQYEHINALTVSKSAPLSATDGPQLLSRSNDNELNDLVRKSFAFDALGISAAPPRQNRDDVKAISILDKTAQLIDSRWEVGLPWKTDVNMPDSYPTALTRLRSIERKMLRNIGFAERYSERMQHLLINDYAREINDSETGPRVWYLPHFGVDNPNKSKLRLVFDAAAATRGFCLNSYLLQGPDLLESLVGIMLRFRENSVGISADIRDMFLRVKIRQDDQHALRFLWSTAGEIKTYAMTSLIFGANCSPFVAQYIKNKNAERFSEEMPDSVHTIIKNHYCDDYVDSFQNKDQAIKSMNEITLIHKQGGFDIRNWTSNDQSVCEAAPKESLSQASVGLDFSGDELFERTLGLRWYPNSDCLGFNLSVRNVSKNILAGQQKPTKRELLRIVMSVFDIYGLLAPFIMKAKIILQSTWKQNISWDQKITDEMFVVFKEWISQIDTINTLRIPRWYFSSFQRAGDSDKRKSLDLHIFCDASPSAYTTCAYWRSYHDEDKGDIGVAFIMSKSRLAPLKSSSVPRLELQAAVIGCRLADTIKKEHRLDINKTFFWTDSTTVLMWIRNDHRNYNTFVANRLGEIDTLSSPVEWHYVPTEMNVADLATKNNNYRLTDECEWFRGPEFLRQPANRWPLEPENKQNIKDTDLESKIILTVTHTNQESLNLPVPDPSRFSSWLRLLRATASVLLFIERCKKKPVSVITAELIEQAEVLILRHSQNSAFSTDIQSLKKRGVVDRTSRLRTLTPIIGKDGLLRVQGRIDAAKDICANIKSPIILDGRDYIARLIVRHYHEHAAHGANEMLVNELRQKYWLLRLRPTVRTVSSQCLFCRLHKLNPQPPRLGDLPEGRLAHHQRPFSHCGLDLFGPMDVAVGRRREKRYGVLFTCLTIRAVHLEIVPSLSTDSLIMALRRMASRRGWPTKLYSDNGTNLKGAEAELKRALDELDENYLQEYAANYKIDWHFISPASPHMGGSWERLIRSVKTALKVVLKERAPREETLITLLAEVEAMVNSRPLHHVSVELDANEALTPNHFLLGSSSGLPIPGEFHDGDLYLRRQWRIAQRLADLFWHRWVREILPSLLPRQKWTEECVPLQEGDLVFIADPNSPRNCWPKGKIIKTYPGGDGRVRVVDVLTKTGVLRRPATRIARLPKGDECRQDDTGGRL